MMGCVISPLLFVLVIEMILPSARDNANKITGPSMKAFLDDVTLVIESRSHIEQLVTHLQVLFKWVLMKIKPSKCCSLSLIKRIYKEIEFSVDGHEIATIHKKAFRASVTFNPYHLLIDVIGRT